MGVFRVNRNKDYTVMSNCHLRDENLSLKAKGLLSVMLSLPDDWDYSIKGLAAISKEGEKAIRTVLTEIEDAGYLKRTRVKDEKGHFSDVIYDIFEKPCKKESETAENQGIEPCAQKRHVEERHVDGARVEKDIQLNIKELNTKELNTKELKKESKEKAQDIVKLYNDTCVSLPSVKALTTKRIKAVNARLKNYSIADIQKTFAMAEASLFLKGKNDRGWRADFDWLINENNMVKVLEGRYLNNVQQDIVTKKDPLTKKFENTASWLERRKQEA